MSLNIKMPISGISREWSETNDRFCIYDSQLCVQIDGSLYEVESGDCINIEYDDLVELIDVEIIVKKRDVK